MNSRFETIMKINLTVEAIFALVPIRWTAWAPAVHLGGAVQ
jgi:hypothetical protein